MCGIAGIYSFSKPVDSSLESVCRTLLGGLQHRGPDSEGMISSGNAILGHRRLSIIDLSDAAKQPISNEDGSIWLVFNGEIYNHRELRSLLISKGHQFKSKTDSEVIVHLYEQYGTECLEHLRGMFAFAIWDEKSKQFFAARDRFGIKPFYYVLNSSQLLFASEVRALVSGGAASNELDQRAINHFLQYGSVASPHTIFKKIQSLEPGHYIVCKDSGASIHRYWDLKKCLNIQDDAPPREDELEQLMDQCIDQHLVSDVPWAVLLSGGLDSSALAALASRKNQERISTLTLSFHEKELDESYYAGKVSAHLSTKHHEFKIGGEDVVQEIPLFLAAMDQPSVDGLNTFLVSKYAKECGFRVLISGLGGDEVFAGYDHFRKVAGLFKTYRFLEKFPGEIRNVLAGGLEKAGQMLGLSGARRLQYLNQKGLSGIYRIYRGLFPPQSISDLLNCGVEDVKPGIVKGLEDLPTDLDRAVLMEFEYYLHNQLLRDTDVLSMHHSIEMRVPFLDHKLVTYLMSKSAKNRFDPKIHKKYLRKLVQKDLPREILDRPKRGFILPFDRWMRTTMKNSVEIVLMDSGSSILDAKAVKNIWKQFLSGKVHWSLPWSLFVLKNYMDRLKQNPVKRETLPV